MRTLAEYEVLAAAAHGHMCAGQILGLRMAIHGLELLGVEEPEGKDRKRLVTFVEIDRCATDAIPVVTGCRLGKRALKFRDFGKVAASCSATWRRKDPCGWSRANRRNSGRKSYIRRSVTRTGSKCRPIGKWTRLSFSNTNGCGWTSGRRSFRGTKERVISARNARRESISNVR